MLKRSHPARRARTVAGIAGATTYVTLVWVISAESESAATINLSAALDPTGQPATETSNGLQLTGAANPVAALPDPALVGAQVGTVDGAENGTAGAQALDGSNTSSTPQAGPTETTAPATSMTSAPADATTAPATTAAPITTPTTAAPTSAVPTSAVPTSAPPTSGDSTTAAPTTAAPTTAAPTTSTPAPTTTTSSAS